MTGDDRDEPRFDTNINTLKRICSIDCFSGTGKGGQHRNRHYSCVRIYHPPSNITVLGTEQRSQHRNKKLAFERLIEKLNELNKVEKKRIPTRPGKAAKNKGKKNKVLQSLKKRLRKKVDDSEM